MMKHRHILISLFFLFGLLIPCGIAYSQTLRKVLFSMGNEEYPVYDESRIYMENQDATVSLVTMTYDSNYFLYENGEKKGPFPDTESCGFVPDPDDGDMYSSNYFFEGVPPAADMIQYDEYGKIIINTGGKNYGPYESVYNIYVNNHGKFKMAITGEGMKLSLLTGKGELIPLEGTVYSVNISPSGDHVMAVVETGSMAAMEYMTRDYSGMTQEEILEAIREIEEKQKNAPPPEVFIYFDDGTKFGPYPQEPIMMGNPGYCKTGGDNWTLLLYKDLYVNGSLLATLEDDYVSSGDIWLSEDGTRFAVINYEKLHFSDGESYEYPLKVKLIKREGRTWVTWISIENRTDVVVYQKPL